MVSVVITAAGSGSRLGGVPKQMRLLGDRPLILHTVQMFDQHSKIASIVVVGRQMDLEILEDMIFPLQTPCKIVPGGATRQKSVEAGVDAVSESTEIVLIHDSARPFVSERIITDVIESAERFGAAAAALPIWDTTRYGDRGVFTKTVSRDGLYAMQTPQGFQYDLLRTAFDAAGKASQATDDVALMYGIGQTVQIVHGDVRNFKITTESDLDWATRIWEIENLTH